MSRLVVSRHPPQKYMDLAGEVSESTHNGDRLNLPAAHAYRNEVAQAILRLQEIFKPSDRQPHWHLRGSNIDVELIIGANGRSEISLSGTATSWYQKQQAFEVVKAQAGELNLPVSTERIVVPEPRMFVPDSDV
jgi:hypothetical protein